MSEKNFKRSAGKGYYIALILCAAAIGITSYVFYRNEDTTAGLEASAPEQQADIPVLATQPKTPAITVPEATVPTERKPLQTAAPLEGQEIFGYSMEVLSYNQTTRDWRTHNGVDIAAEEGTEVMAAADGEVYTVYEDESLGHTVVIRHEGGYTTRYSSLGADVAVSAGQPVSMGQTIGTVGTSALMENALGDHVHFTVTKDDEPVDPMEFLR